LFVVFNVQNNNLFPVQKNVIDHPYAGIDERLIFTAHGVFFCLKSTGGPQIVIKRRFIGINLPFIGGNVDKYQKTCSAACRIPPFNQLIY
jgi:hypothetical protein